MIYLFVTGTSYTGSTLLSFLLNAHPQIATVGETTGPIPNIEDPDQYPCSCGSTLTVCPFWVDVQQRMASRGISFGPRDWRTEFNIFTNRYLRMGLTRSLRSSLLDQTRDAVLWRVPQLRERFEEVGQRIEALADSVVAITGKPVFADAAKDPIRARMLARFTRFELRVVHLIRDAPGYVASAIKNTAPPMGLHQAIRSWNRIGGHVERIFAELPPQRRLRIRYEDLCTDVEGTLAHIARFCDLDPATGAPDFRATEHHIIGNQMRLRTSSEIRLDESWRDRLSAADLATVLELTRQRRERFGYGEIPPARATKGPDLGAPGHEHGS